MYFSQQLIGNSRSGQRQWNAVLSARARANRHEQALANTVRVNAGLIPADVYQEFDRVSVERMRSDDGDTILNDILALSRSISIGKLVTRFRQVSDAGLAQTSMSGQVGVKLDQVDYTYDGALIPIHDTGFFRDWREHEGGLTEDFDALIDDQRENVATLRRHIVAQLLDGHVDKDGNFIVVDGLSWQGIRNDSRVVQIDLGAGGLNFDFTSTANTGQQIKDAWIQMRDIMWITNLCEMPLTYYMSREIVSNFERKFSTQYDAKIIQQELVGLTGVADIKHSSVLSGNEIIAMPLNGEKIRPLVGMGVNTVALPRPLYNSRYEFWTWGAIGFQVKTGYFNRSCVMHAAV